MVSKPTKRLGEALHLVAADRRQAGEGAASGLVARLRPASVGPEGMSLAVRIEIVARLAGRGSGGSSRLRTSRRGFLARLGAGALVLGRAPVAASAGKPLRGIFPIAQTPFTANDRLDADALIGELRFVARGRVHGFVWPQLASEWSVLSEGERFEGAEAIGAEGRKLSPAIVLGVQGADAGAAVRFARHAAKSGADALISLPPAGPNSADAVVDYYRAVARATELPFFVQAVGDMSVDTVLALYRAAPNIRYLKDEAGQPLMRVARLREASGDELRIFTGAHGRTLIEEMRRGFSGSMPAASFADLYASAWDLWHGGEESRAMAVFAKAAMLIEEVTLYGIESLKYILHLRGVFPNWRTRRVPGAPPAGSGLAGGVVFDEAAKASLRQMLDFVKSDLRVRAPG